VTPSDLSARGETILRGGRERRQGLDRPFTTLGDRVCTFELPGSGGGLYVEDNIRKRDRRTDTATGALLDTIVEETRRPLVRCIRELGAELERLKSEVRVGNGIAIYLREKLEEVSTDLRKLPTGALVDAVVRHVAWQRGEIHRLTKVVLAQRTIIDESDHAPASSGSGTVI